MPKIFVDMGYFLALEIADDDNHTAATNHWRQLTRIPQDLFTTSYIFDEVVTFLNSRGAHAKAVQIGNRLLASTSIRLIYVDDTIFQSAWEYFRRHQDKRYSFTDCTSFIVMQQNGITTALSFDNHFTQAGFIKLP